MRLQRLTCWYERLEQMSRRTITCRSARGQEFAAPRLADELCRESKSLRPLSHLCRVAIHEACHSASPHHAIQRFDASVEVGSADVTCAPQWGRLMIDNICLIESACTRCEAEMGAQEICRLASSHYCLGGEGF